MGIQFYIDLLLHFKSLNMVSNILEILVALSFLIIAIECRPKKGYDDIINYRKYLCMTADCEPEAKQNDDVEDTTDQQYVDYEPMEDSSQAVPDEHPVHKINYTDFLCMTEQCDTDLGRLGTYHLPASCNPSKLGECQYILMWFHIAHYQVKFVIFSKGVDKTAIGFSLIQDDHFAESVLVTFNKNQERTENRIDKDGNNIAIKKNFMTDVIIEKLKKNYLLVKFNLILTDDIKNMFARPGGLYYFVDGPSHNMSDEKYVWLPQKADLSNFLYDGYEFDTTTMDTTLQRHPCYDIVGDVLNKVLKKLNVKKKVQKKAAFLVDAILENRNEYEYSEEDNKLFDENPESFFWTTSSEEERDYNYDMTDLPPLDRLLKDYDKIMNAKI